jgi:hypothetical protein
LAEGTVCGGAALVTTAAAAAAAAAAAMAFDAPGASDESAAFIFLPTLEPLRSETDVRFSLSGSTFCCCCFRANDVASFAKLLKAAISSSSVP